MWLFRKRLTYPAPETLIIQPVTETTVNRQPDDSLEIRWKQTGSVRIYGGTQPELIDREKVLAENTGAGYAIINGLEPNTRYYFELVFDDGRRIITAERIMAVEGVVNLRDIGGYITRDGQRVKWGKSFDLASSR